MYQGKQWEIISQFRRHSVMVQSDPDDWTELVQNLKPQNYRRSETIRPGGDTSGRVTILHSGVALVSSVLVSGKEVITQLNGPGTAWGVPSMLSPNPTSRTSLIAMTECEVWHIPRHMMREWMERDCANLQKLLQYECRKGGIFVQRIEMLALPKIKCRVATLLLSLCYDIGYDAGDSVAIPLRITHQQIADLVHSDRVTVARIISGFVKKQLMEKRDGGYWINGIEELYAIALDMV